MKRFYFVFIVCFLSMELVNTMQAQEITQTEAVKSVTVLNMKGAIGPAFTDYLQRGIEEAKNNRSQLLVIKMNTPGGLLSSTRDMASEILSSPVPVAVWVTPSGAHAASAGTFLLYAAHIAAMDEGTNVGAATPIEMGGSPVADDKDNKDKNAHSSSEKAGRAKAIEDTTAFIRGLAEMRGRNLEWAEKAVTDADSLTAREALDKNVIDYIAVSLPELLAAVDGKTIAVKNSDQITLKTANAEVIAYEPDIRTQILSYITDPNVAFILMTIGVYGLILEFYNPGTLIPGTIGGICLVIGLFAMNILPVNAAGVALIVLAMVLILAEAFIPSFGVLGIGGIVAFVFGATILFDGSSMPGLALEIELVLGMATLGLVMVGGIVWLLANAYKRQVSTGTESMIGQSAEVLEWRADQGRVRVQSEEWHAQSPQKIDLKEGETVYVAEVKGLSVIVHKTKTMR